MSYTVEGLQPLTKHSSRLTTTHNIPIVGLYPDTVNSITITLEDKSGQLYEGTTQITTSPLPSFFPEIEIVKLDRSRMETGLHLLELLVPNGDKFDSYSIYFDDNGEVRWYIDLSEMRRIAFSIPRLKNGNSLYVSWIDVLELNELGETINQWQLGGYAGDHDIKELPNGNLLMGASKRGSTIYQHGTLRKTRYDFAVELDRQSMNAIKEWDMRSVLDVDRGLLNQELGRDNYYDWFHINSVNYDDRDNSILVSGRNQGVVKLDQANRPKWILAPHKGWGKSGIKGDGAETTPYLLTAIDKKGDVLSEEVQQGTMRTSDFEWPTGQHNIQILNNGNLLLFDNGFSRNFQQIPTYSRAVEYKIDDKNKTIQQIWEYGKERGLDMFSGITSSVQVLPETQNRLITSGYIRASTDEPHAKMIEITYPNNEVVFEARAYFKNTAPPEVVQWAKFDVVYKGQRIDLLQE